jgi:biotin transport system substrate-specific component
MNSGTSTRTLVRSALMSALIAAGAVIAIPVGPVPIVLQNLFVFLAGLLLGPRGGLTSVGLYLLAGALGLPVFAGATGGLGRFAGPTGGYLIGYLPAVAVIGWVSERLGRRTAGNSLALALGIPLVYACGLPWLKLVTGFSVEKTLAVGLLPFLPGDLLKAAAALVITRVLAPALHRRDARGAPEAS